MTLMLDESIESKYNSASLSYN
jgi:hypothetical protein